MELVFDISQDELPIFQAETDEHLQLLDEGLVRLERDERDPELLQTLFRAAHTLKGIAGMIGHKRMVDLTHKVEAVFDAVRKDEISVSTPMIDLCLEGVDGLRILRDEVIDGQTSQVDFSILVERFISFLQTHHAKIGNIPETIPTVVEPGSNHQTAPATLDHTYRVVAEISPVSIASAARAYQLLLTLQDIGTILESNPTQEMIETAVPVKVFEAQVYSDLPVSEIEKVLRLVSEVDRISVTLEGQNEVQKPDYQEQLPVQPENLDQPAEKFDQLGEFLIKKGYIAQAQLNQALGLQSSGEKNRLGQVLVKIGAITPEKMDQALGEMIEAQKTVLHALQTGTADRAPREKAADKTVRTSVERLDNLMNLVGELITDRNRLAQTRNNLDIRFRGDEQVGILVDTVTHIARITDQLQEEVMRIRMLPVSNVFSKFPRLVRDLSQKVGKDIELVVRGEDTELDRSVIDELNDPLIHLLRNSVDHGIEKPADRAAAGKPARGRILLTAHHEQGRIMITIEDDGAGIDIERLKNAAVQKGLVTEADVAIMPDDKAIDLIFQSGLSTAKKITDVSGRGVGMDIVRNNIEHVNGSIQVETWPGRGTQFQIILPLTLAIVPTLLVRVENNTFAIPLASVTETRRVGKDEISTVRNNPVILLRNKVLTLVSLAYVFGLPVSKQDKQYQYIVVVNSGKTQIGLMVDTLVGEEEVVVKSMGALIGDIPGVSSAAILGDGQVALIADIQGLYKLSGIH